MRILVNAVGARMGGAARHLQPFLEALLNVRPDWKLVVCIGHGDEGAVASDRHVELDARLEMFETTGTGIAARLKWDLCGATSFANLHNADAILSLTNYGPIAPDRPSVLYQRNSIYFDPYWIRRSSVRHRAVASVRRKLAFAELARSSAVVAPTRAMLSYLRAWSHASLPTRAEVITHAVNSERFVFIEPRRDRHNAEVRLLTVAHAASHKGLETAISCVAHLQRLGISSELALTVAPTGNGPSQGYVDRLLRHARRQGVEDQVEWMGSHPSVESLYRQADVLLFPSLTESFGFPLVEALATGTAIVASAIPSSIEVAGHNAMYFVPGDAATAAAHVVSIMQRDGTAVAVCAAEGRALAETMTWQRNAAAVARLLEEVSSGSHLSM